MEKETGAFNWPKGSVRAVLIFALAGSLVYGYIATGEVNIDIKELCLFMLGYYFGKDAK